MDRSGWASRRTSGQDVHRGTCRGASDLWDGAAAIRYTQPVNSLRYTSLLVEPHLWLSSIGRQSFPSTTLVDLAVCISQVVVHVLHRHRSLVAAAR